MFLGQEATSQPQALPWRVDHTPEVLPMVVQGQVDEGVSLLAEHIPPLPSIQLLQDRNGTELAVAHNEYRYILWYPFMYISEQGPLLDRRAMPAFALDPRPDNRDRAATVGDGDHQQLMMEADLAPVNDQSNLTMLSLALEKLFPYRTVPLAYANGAHQQPSQPLDFAG